MDYKEEYQKALERAKKGLPIDEVFPELKESEDERIRKELLKEIEFIIPHECETDSEGLILFSYYARIDKYRAYLEKQKEPKPAEWPSNISNCPHNCKKCFAKCLYRKEDNPELNKHAEIHDPTDEELESHRKQLHDFKAFAAKQATEHHISFVHDFEWEAFCGELLSYFNEQQNPADLSKLMVHKEPYIAPVPVPMVADEQKPAEWSEEDETAFGDLMWCIEQARKSAKDENDMGNIWFAENWAKNRLKSLRPQPHWKPSEEQMKALLSELPVIKGSGDKVQDILGSLYDDLKKQM